MIRRQVVRSALASALLLFLAGCTSLTPHAQDGEAAPRSMRPAAHPFHDTIDFSGRLSVRYQSGHKDEALHGSFAWAQTPRQTTITLLSPLGQTIAVIDVKPQGATLAQAGKAERAAADVDALTVATLGWPLPVAGLRDWLQGFAVDSAGQRFVASPRATEVNTHDGWRIRYVSWQDDTESSAQHRPKRIDLARFTEQAGDVSIRIIIDTWQAH